MRRSTGIIEAVPQLEEMAQNDPVKKIRYIAKESLLLIRLSRTSLEEDSDAHLEIVRELGEMKSLRGLPRLQEMFDELMVKVEALPDFEEGTDIEDLEPADAEALGIYKYAIAYNYAINQINSYQGFYRWCWQYIPWTFAWIGAHLDGVGACDYFWSDGCHQYGAR